MANDKIERILQASIKLFSEKGYDAVSVDEIALMAGVSKGIIFFYFKNKNNLIIRAALTSVPLKQMVDFNGKQHFNLNNMLFEFGNIFIDSYSDKYIRNLFLYTIGYKNNYPDLNKRLKELCFTEFDNMFNIAEELKKSKIPLPVRRAFFGSLICYIIWWDENTMGKHEYINDLVKLIL